MDSSAQFRILHTVSGRSIPETAELLGENIRNINNWLKSVAPRYESTLQRMEEADEADEQWVSATVDATVDFAEKMEKIHGAAPEYLSMSFFQNESDYMESPNGYEAFSIPYRQYIARMVRVYSVLSYLGYEVRFSYIVM